MTNQMIELDPKIIQCLDVFEKIFVKKEQVIISEIEPDLFKFVHPDVMFIGDDRADCIHTETWLSPSKPSGEAMFQVLKDLAHGEDVGLEFIERWTSFFKTLDCAYGILVQSAAAAPRHEGMFPIGRLTFHMVDDGWRFLQQEDSIGGVLLNKLRNVLLYMANKGDPKSLELMRVLDDNGSFFLPISNSYKEFWTQVPMSSDWDCQVTETCINYDLGFGGQLGWYRLDKLMKEGGVETFLNFDKKAIEALHDHLMERLKGFERLTTAAKGIITVHCQESFEDIARDFRYSYGLYE